MEKKQSFVSKKLIRLLDKNIQLCKDKFPRLNVIDAGPDYDSEEDIASLDELNKLRQSNYYG